MSPPARIRATVCELEGNLDQLETEWKALVDHVQQARSDLVLLPEMPFGPWLAATREVDVAAWDRSVALHEAWISKLPELGARVVATTRPVKLPGGRFNQAIVWERDKPLRPGHRKTYLPDEPGFWEGTWYRRGPTRFDPQPTSLGPVGFVICTELWFLEHARQYAKSGVDLLLCPRATESATVDKWTAAGRVAAVCAGAFGLSSNWRGPAGDLRMGGGGWVCDPDGALLARTSASTPWVTLDLDLTRAVGSPGTELEFAL